MNSQDINVDFTLPDLTNEIGSLPNLYFACGGNSDVYKAEWKPSGCSTHLPLNSTSMGVAVKLFRPIMKDSEGRPIPKEVGKAILEKRFKREWKNWYKLEHHTNVLPLLGKYEIQTPVPRIGLVSPFRSGEDIVTFLCLHGEEADRQDLLKGIIAGIVHIHSKGLTHGDIKPRNVIVSESESIPGQWIPEIADFGGSRLEKGDTTGLKNTIQYTSPEALIQEEGTNANVTQQSDVYSFAMTMLEILSGRAPFSSTKEHLLVYQLLSGVLIPKESEYPLMHSSNKKSHWQLMSKCWKHIPTERPSMKDVEQAFLKSLIPSHHVSV